MYNYKDLTDFEKLTFAESYIKELKVQLRVQEESAIKAVKSKLELIEDFKNFSNGNRKLVHYKQEMVSLSVKKKKAEKEYNKSEGKNYKLRQQLREKDVIIKDMMIRLDYIKKEV